MRRCITLFAMSLTLIILSATQAVACYPDYGYGGHGRYGVVGGFIEPGDYAGYGASNRENGQYRWHDHQWWIWTLENEWMPLDTGEQCQNDEQAYDVQRPIIKNFSGGAIKIVNPAGNKATLNYTLNGAAYAIPPGYSQEIEEDRDWVIEFSRGANLADVQYSLQSGVYTFVLTDKGWELSRGEFQKNAASTLAPRPTKAAPPTPHPPKTTTSNPSQE
jgi:hypothetical protein